MSAITDSPDFSNAILIDILHEEQVCGYLFKNPYAVNLLPKYGFLTEESAMDDGGEDDELNVSFTPWIPLTMDKEIPVRYDWLVTVVSPAKEIEKLYEEMINGQDNQTDSTDEQ